MTDAPTPFPDTGQSQPAEQTRPNEPEADARVGLSLFWRTFFLLALLLFGSILAWLQTLRALEFEPRAVQTAQQIASLVNLSRAALIHADAIHRVSLIKTMTDQEGVRIVPREPHDSYEPFDTDALGQQITKELKSKLGSDTVVANSVNREEGLWVGFTIDEDHYWLLTDRARFNRTAGRTWLIWLLTAAALSLAGAALIARRINQPLKQLSFAASRVRKGDFEASRLDESVVTSEIRAVNVGFNRMTRTLAQVEQDRAIMLAGISHDLRTPLARLRLEVELSVHHPQARANMAADIDQIDAIIDKFREYARPTCVALSSVALRQVMETCLSGLRNRNDILVKLDLDPDLLVLADAVELARVITNLLENAIRYGKTASSGVACVDISASAQDRWARITLCDQGPGVPDEQLAKLTKPFFRGEEARTAANGAGLGLAIVEKTIARMGGSFKLSKAPGGGLAAHIKLQLAPAAARTGT